MRMSAKVIRKRIDDKFWLQVTGRCRKWDQTMHYIKTTTKYKTERCDELNANEEARETIFRNVIPTKS